MDEKELESRIEKLEKEIEKEQKNVAYILLFQFMLVSGFVTLISCLSFL